VAVAGVTQAYYPGTSLEGLKKTTLKVEIGDLQTDI
jgi:hypothetical protein